MLSINNLLLPIAILIFIIIFSIIITLSVECWRTSIFSIFFWLDSFLAGKSFLFNPIRWIISSFQTVNMHCVAMDLDTIEHRSGHEWVFKLVHFVVPHAFSSWKVLVESRIHFHRVHILRRHRILYTLSAVYSMVVYPVHTDHISVVPRHRSHFCFVQFRKCSWPLQWNWSVSFSRQIHDPFLSFLYVFLRVTTNHYGEFRTY